MARSVLPLAVVAIATLSLSGCSLFQRPQRPAWRAQAEKACFAEKKIQVSAYVQLAKEIEKQARIAEDEGLKLAVRLNTFSDLPWEARAWGAIPQQFPHVQFYDYAKTYGRAGKLPPNYSICWSWTEKPKDQEYCHRLLLAGENVAIVFGQHGRGFTGPRAYDQHLPGWIDVFGDRFVVYDGDKSDLRFLDPGPTTSGRGRVCGLRLKSATNVAHEAGLNSGFAKVV